MRALRLAAVAVMCAALGAGAASDVEKKIAVVDMERLLRAHPDFRPAEARLETKKVEFESEREKMIEDLDSLKKQLEDLAAQIEDKTLTDEVRKQKRGQAEQQIKEIRESQLQIRETSSLRQRQLGDMAKRMRESIVATINELVSEHAKRHGYALVLDSSGVGMNGFPHVTYRDPAMDVTEPLLKTVSGLKPSIRPVDDKGAPEGATKKRGNADSAPSPLLAPLADPER